MSITVVALSPAQLTSLLADPSQLDGMPVLAGAAPPEFLLRAASADLALFAFVSASPAQVVGSAMLKRRPEAGRVEIGYGVADAARGKGVATAGVGQMVARAFADAGVREVYAETAVDNPASRRVLEKAGFSHIGQRDSEEDGRVDQWSLTRANPPPVRIIGLGYVSVYVADVPAAVAFYTRVFGPPAAEDARNAFVGWRMGTTWLTVFPSRAGTDPAGNPRNAEFAVQVATPAEVDLLHTTLTAAGARTVMAPADTVMYEPMRYCCVDDPFGMRIDVYCPIGP